MNEQIDKTFLGEEAALEANGNAHGALAAAAAVGRQAVLGVDHALLLRAATHMNTAKRDSEVSKEHKQASSKTEGAYVARTGLVRFGFVALRAANVVCNTESRANNSEQCSWRQRKAQDRLPGFEGPMDGPACNHPERKARKMDEQPRKRKEEPKEKAEREL